MVKHQNKVSTGITKAGNVFVKFYCRGKRYRFSNGRAIDREIFPNKEKCKTAKQQKLSVLKSAFEVALFDGWLPQEKEDETKQTSKVEIHDILESSYEEYFASKNSYLYKRDLRWAMNTFLKYLNTLSKNRMTIDELTPKTLIECLINIHYMRPQNTFSGVSIYIVSILIKRKFNENSIC